MRDRGFMKPTDGKGPTEDEGIIGGDNANAPTNTKGKKMFRGPVTCKRCGEKGYIQASSKCSLNGMAKKRQVLISFI